jgi:hypothetical protein
MNDLSKLKAEMPLIAKFVSKNQILTLVLGAVDGEESDFFIEKGLEIAKTLKTMPKTYEQDGLGDKSIVHLHYFLGNADWYITEKDMGECPDSKEVSEQLQAFGLADLGMGYPELGYISIEELKSVGAELDLYWTPKTLAEVKAA